MIVNYEESKDRNAYLGGDIVFYLDHDIPVKNAGQFLNEIERRARPGEITISQQMNEPRRRFAAKLQAAAGVCTLRTNQKWQGEVRRQVDSKRMALILL